MTERSPSRGLRAWVQRAIDGAGVRLDGGRPWDPQIRDERFFRRMNEVPTLAMIGIVILVIVKPF